MDYFEFVLRVQRTDHDYIAEVVSSPLGESAVASSSITPDPMQVTALRSELAAKPTREAEQALGTLLYNTLFTGRVQETMMASLNEARRLYRGLRLQLIIEPNELSSLPWEMLFNPSSEQFLALDSSTPVVRFLRLPGTRMQRSTEPPVRVRPPLKVLALFANPSTSRSMDFSRNLLVMQDALAPLIASGLIHLTTLEHATVPEMVNILRSERIDILYYQGHVGFDSETRSSYLLLEGERGPVVKGIQPLSYTLSRTNVRLVVINSIDMAAGGAAYELVRRGSPAVVATLEPLSNDETIGFLREFHRSLAYSQPVDAAVAEGRMALHAKLGPNARWASPILVTRKNDLWQILQKEQL